MSAAQIRILISVILALIAAIAWQHPAEAGLGVVPSKIEINVKPGSHAERIVNIYNTGNQTIRVECHMLDFNLDSTGEPAFLATQAEDLACSQWLSVQPASFEMQPESIKEVKIKAELPSKAFSNDKAAYLRIKSTGSILDAQAKPTAILDALVLLSSQDDMSLAKGQKSDVKVSMDVPINKRLWLSGNLPVSLNVRNLGKDHADISGTLVINNSGEQIGHSNFPEFVVFPSSSRTKSQDVKFVDESGLLDISLIDLNGGSIEGPRNFRVMVLSRTAQRVVLICLCAAFVFLLSVALRRKKLKVEEQGGLIQ